MVGSSVQKPILFTALIVELHYIEQRLFRSVMHVWRGELDVAQGWRLERSDVLLLSRDQKAAPVR